MSNTPTGWQQLGAISPVELQDARLYLQYALQWVERAALCGQEEDSEEVAEAVAEEATTETTQTSDNPLLFWDSQAQGFFSRPFADDRRVGLIIAEGDATLSFGAREQPRTNLQLFELNGRTDAEARLWVREQIEDSAHDTTEYNDPSSLAPHPLAEGARYKLSEHRESIAEVARWFANAQLLLEGLRTNNGNPDEKIFCSLEQFDIRLHHHRNKATREPHARMELGLSLGDGYYPQPYFYAIAKPDWQSEPAFANDLCIFHKKDFTGFLVLSEKIVHLADQESASADFLQQAIKLPI